MNKFFIIQPLDSYKQEGKRSDNQINKLYKNDPTFKEIFIYSTQFYLDDIIYKKRKLYNGTKSIYYSFILYNNSIEEYKDQISKNSNNGIITLSKPPKSISLLFDNEKIILYSKDIWNEIAAYEYRKEKDEEKRDDVIFPIKQRSIYPIQTPTYIVPTNIFNEL